MNALIDASNLEGVNMQIQLVGVENEDIDSQQQIYSHAVQVLFHYTNMKTAAMNVCIHLHLCREKFKSKGAEAGWELFCLKNFAPLDMQMTHIRSAIRTGRALISALNSQRLHNDPRARTTFEQMSRYALTTFSESPEEIREELAVRLVTLADEQARAPTSTDVRAEVAELMAELNDKNDALQRKDTALTRMNQELQASDARVSELRETVERLNAEVTRLSNQPKVTVETLDPASEATLKSVKEAEAQLASLTNDLRLARNELRAVEEERKRKEDEVETFKADNARAEYEKTALFQFTQELNTLKGKWTSVFFKHKDTEISDETKERITNAAAELRKLADQLETVCSPTFEVCPS